VLINVTVEVDQVAIPKFVNYISRNNELQKQGEVPMIAG
jgi:hypothetical protein